MEEAIKAVSSARGYDIRDFTLVAFGGGGPMHAGRMALDLGIPSVLVPLTPGVHSALGLLMSDVKHDYVRSKLVGLEELDLDRDQSDVSSADRPGQEPNCTAKASPTKRSRSSLISICATPARATSLPFPAPMPPLNKEDLTVMRRPFRHAARAEFRPQSRDRTGGAGESALDLPRPGAPGQTLARQSHRAAKSKQAKTGERKVFFGKEHGMLATQIYNRELFEPGHQITGPSHRRAIGHHHGDSSGTGSRRWTNIGNIIIKEKT